MLSLSILIIPFAETGSLYARSGPAATTKITHTPLTYFVPGHRILVSASVADAKGVMMARCYFKAAEEADFVFVDMKWQEKDKYRGVLPAPSTDSGTIEYIILAVNSEKVVVKSQQFAVKRSKKKMPPWQVLKTGEAVAVKTELPNPPKQLKGFSDNMVMDVVESSFRFGVVVAGIYLAAKTAGVAAPSGAIAGGTVTASTAGAASAGAAVAAGAAGAAGGIGAGAVVLGAAAVAGGAAVAVKALDKKENIAVVITVTDSGSAKDDVFEVYLDDNHLGTVGKGESQTWSKELEEDSSHTLRVTCIDDGDNGIDIGTFTLSISNSNFSPVNETVNMNESKEYTFKVNSGG
ncbi:MAG: hypothetical protein GY757_28175 [bacterium]|nr:hypothetical protein [bacterium]